MVRGITALERRLFELRVSTEGWLVILLSGQAMVMIWVVAIVAISPALSIAFLISLITISIEHVLCANLCGCIQTLRVSHLKKELTTQ